MSSTRTGRPPASVVVWPAAHWLTSRLSRGEYARISSPNHRLPPCPSLRTRIASAPYCRSHARWRQQEVHWLLRHHQAHQNRFRGGSSNLRRLVPRASIRLCDLQVEIIIVYYHNVSVTFSCCGATFWRPSPCLDPTSSDWAERPEKARPPKKRYRWRCEQPHPK